MASPAVSARGAYRSLLRATRIAFDSDLRILAAARQEARQKFSDNRNESVDTPMNIKHAMEVADILRRNIVQGARDAGNEDGKWQLRIHPDIERGQSEYIDLEGKSVKVEKPCPPS